MRCHRQAYGSLLKCPWQYLFLHLHISLWHQHLRQALNLAHELNDPEIIDQVSELLPTGTEHAVGPVLE